MITTLLEWAHIIAYLFSTSWVFFLWRALIFSIGFACEYLCMCILARATTRKLLWDAFKCTLFMMLTLVSITMFMSMLLIVFRPHTPLERHPFIVLCISLIFATLVKVWFPLHYFKPNPQSQARWPWICKVFFWTFMASVLSSTVLFISMRTLISLKLKS